MYRRILLLSPHVHAVHGEHDAAQMKVQSPPPGLVGHEGPSEVQGVRLQQQGKHDQAQQPGPTYGPQSAEQRMWHAGPLLFECRPNGTHRPTGMFLTVGPAQAVRE